MRMRSMVLLAASATTLLAGCDGRTKQTNEVASTASADVTTNTATLNDPAATDAVTPVPAPAPSDDTMAADTGDMTIDDTAQGAANVIRRYYADLDRGDFRAAYGRWGNDGQDSHQSFADFKRGFAETATTSVEVGAPGDGEGGAGSIYIDVPVTVHARLKDGTEQRFSGHYSLRRVNDVPGSTQAQRRWHLYAAALKKD